MGGGMHEDVNRPGSVAVAVDPKAESSVGSLAVSTVEGQSEREG